MPTFLLGKDLYIYIYIYIYIYGHVRSFIPPFPEAKFCGVPSHVFDKSGYTNGKKGCGTLLSCMIFISSFMKIGQMVQTLLEGTDMMIPQVCLFLISKESKLKDMCELL
jgi:hypothetical protein